MAPFTVSVDIHKGASFPGQPENSDLYKMRDEYRAAVLEGSLAFWETRNNKTHLPTKESKDELRALKLQHDDLRKHALIFMSEAEIKQLHSEAMEEAQRIATARRDAAPESYRRRIGGNSSLISWTSTKTGCTRSIVKNTTTAASFPLALATNHAEASDGAISSTSMAKRKQPGCQGGLKRTPSQVQGTEENDVKTAPVSDTSSEQPPASVEQAFQECEPVQVPTGRGREVSDCNKHWAWTSPRVVLLTIALFLAGFCAWLHYPQPVATESHSSCFDAGLEYRKVLEFYNSPDNGFFCTLVVDTDNIALSVCIIDHLIWGLGGPDAHDQSWLLQRKQRQNVGLVSCPSFCCKTDVPMLPDKTKAAVKVLLEGLQPDFIEMFQLSKEAESIDDDEAKLLQGLDDRVSKTVHPTPMLFGSFRVPYALECLNFSSQHKVTAQSDFIKGWVRASWCYIVSEVLPEFSDILEDSDNAREAIGLVFSQSLPALQKRRSANRAQFWTVAEGARTKASNIRALVQAEGVDPASNMMLYLDGPLLNATRANFEDFSDGTRCTFEQDASKRKTNDLAFQADLTNRTTALLDIVNKHGMVTTAASARLWEDPSGIREKVRRGYWQRVEKKNVYTPLLGPPSVNAASDMPTM